MRVTLKDIAKHTGLSASTVSLVLNGKQVRVSASTKEKVLHAANKLNYRPNQLAVGLVTNRTKTIGMIVPDVSNFFFAEVVKSAQAKCKENYYNMILCNTNDDPDNDVEYINLLLDRGVDGILLSIAANAAGNRGAECYRIMKDISKPLVLIDRDSPDVPVPSVMADHELGGYIATKHLLDLGHVRVGCITGPLSLQSSKQRLFGYIRALQEYKITFDPSLVEEGSFQLDTVPAGFRRLLEKKITAVFAQNDLIAYGVYKQVMQMKLRMPQDISLVGYDNHFFTELLEIPLTTMSQPTYQLGEAAVDILLSMIEAGNDQAPESILYVPALVNRKSSGPIQAINL